MRLEFEPNTSGFSPLNGNAVEQNGQEKFAEYLNAGVRAAQSGDRKTARQNLMSALDIDPQSENAWLWLASISEYPEELLVFLNNVLDINPKNERALQWSASTKLLLSKTLVQRGIDAHENGRHDFAVQCFDQALSYDVHNVTAWLWLAALNDSEECRLEYFRRVLEIDPENETAKNAVQAAESGKRDNLYGNAAWCAVNGDREGANDFLNKVLERWPDDRDSWLLRSQLTDSFDEKRGYLQRILQIDPENLHAKTSLELLDDIVATASSHTFELPSDNQPDLAEAVALSSEPTAEPEPSMTVDDEVKFESIPTGDLTVSGVHLVAEEHFEVSEPPTTHFASESVPEQDQDIYEAPASIYEPEETELSHADLVEPEDPFDSVAEPLDLPEAEVVDDRPKILVVENNATARKLMAVKLENSGYHVVCAETGREAVELVRSVMPSLVLADIGMPGMDGYAICRSIRDLDFNALPVVLISGKDGFYEEDLGEAAGASGFITKPFGPETLMKTVENFLAAAPNH